jgi:hypothetical protein
MDEIFAQGIFVDLSINIAMPNGSNLAMPGFEVPFPQMPGLSGNSSNGASGAISVAPVTPASNTATAPGNATSTNTNPGNSSQAAIPTVSAPASNTGTPNTVIMPTAAAVSVGNNSLNDNSGLVINAPQAAVSILLNIAVFNNSTLNGDFMQSATSDVRTLSFSFSSFNF